MQTQANDGLNRIIPEVRMKIISRMVRALTATLFDAAVVIRCWPHPMELTVHLQHPRDWIESVGSDAAALELTRLGLWVTAIWLSVGLGAALLAAAPGRAGAVGRVLARRTLPAVLRRVVVGSIGIGIVLTPVHAGAAPASSAAPTTSTASTDSPANPEPGPDIGWPTDGGGPPVDIPWPTSPAPPASTPSQPVPTPTPTPTPTSAPVPTPTATATPLPKPPIGTDQTDTKKPGTDENGAEQTTVRSGDSLWVIAARRLGPTATPAQVAAAWPAWYSANRDVIGDDPGLLHPGQVLVIPTSKGSTA
jgi:hypothetical protein